MFSWFKKPQYVKPWAPEVPEPTKTVVTPLPPQDEIAYQIGRTESGKTTLRLGDGYYSGGTLRMNDAGVLKLIEMLEATLDFEPVATEGHDGRGPG